MVEKIKKLNLGCGEDIRDGYINIDNVKLAGVDVVHDLDKFPYPFKDNLFYEIFTSHVLEHLTDLLGVMRELHRITKNNGVIKIKVPYYNCSGAYQDPTHKRFFTYTTFDYFLNDVHYCKGLKFELLKRKLIPTRLGKLIPTQKLKLLMSLFLGEIVSELYVELKVIKQPQEVKE